MTYINPSGYPAGHKTVFFMGGLGNQLFQFCLVTYLNHLGIHTRVNPLLLYVPLPNVTRRSFYFKHLFNKFDVYNYTDISKFVIYSLFNRAGIYLEKIPFKLDLENIENITNSKLILGYFQSINLVNEVYPSVKEYLTNSINEQNNDLSDLTLHIRGEDYLQRNNTKYYGQITQEYYEESLEYFIERNHKIKKITILTNDYNYSSKLLSKSKYKRMFDYRMSGNPIHDLYRLARSKKIVSSNSSFSWWASYIGHRNFNSEVIMPKNWTSDKKISELELMHPDWKVI